MKLVLLPGLDGTGDLFAPFCRALGSAIQPIVLRYPADPQLSYQDLEAEVRRNLPSQEPYALLAESFSGPIAIKLAAERPPDLRALILCCSFASNPRPGLVGLRGLIAYIPFARLPAAPLLSLLLGAGASGALRAWVGTIVGGLPSALVAARLQAVMRVDVRAALERLLVPVLYLQAAQDRLVPPASGEEIRRRCADCSLLSLPGPHGLLQVEPEAAARQVQGFVARLSPS